eukprot:scaffold24521_cov38-Cyclotella_meneghiniana.AAC.3
MACLFTAPAVSKSYYQTRQARAVSPPAVINRRSQRRSRSVNNEKPDSNSLSLLTLPLFLPMELGGMACLFTAPAVSSYYANT